MRRRGDRRYSGVEEKGDGGACHLYRLCLHFSSL